MKLETTDKVGTPGDIMDQITRARFPTMNDLKCITTTTVKGDIVPVNYAIPTQPIPAYHSYLHTIIIEFPTTNFKALGIEHRLAGTAVIPAVAAFVRRVSRSHPDLDIARLTKNIDRLLTHSMTKKMILRLFHNALKMGVNEVRYYIDKLKAQDWNPTIIPFDTHLYDVTHQSTYDYEFFEADIVQPLWQHTNMLIRCMNLPRTVKTVDETLLAIYDLGGSSDIMKIINLNLITLTMKTIWNEYNNRMTHRTSIPRQQLKAKSLKWLSRYYTSQLRQEIYQLPHHHYTLHRDNPYKDKRHRMLEREKAVQPTFQYNRKNIKQSHQQYYENTWMKTRLVTLDEHPPATLTIGPIQLASPPL